MVSLHSKSFVVFAVACSVAAATEASFCGADGGQECQTLGTQMLQIETQMLQTKEHKSGIKPPSEQADDEEKKSATSVKPLPISAVAQVSIENATLSPGMIQKAAVIKTGSASSVRENYDDYQLEKAINCAHTRKCGFDDYASVAQSLVLGRAEEIPAFTSIGNSAAAAGIWGKTLMALVEHLTKTASTRSEIYIRNHAHTQTLKCTRTHSYQMNLWDNQFPDVAPGHAMNVKTWTSGNTHGWGDTNAEAYYSVWCGHLNRDVKFRIMIRHHHNIRFQWDDQDTYNPCYDMTLSGHYTTYEKDKRGYGHSDVDHTIASTSSPILVVGSAEVPNKNTRISVTLIPHKQNTRFPVLYEHGNFHGVVHPIVKPYTKNLGGFNDKASSLRVPPGMSLAICEHADYGGTCTHYKKDAASIAMNDGATSAILVVDHPESHHFVR